jgi:hypothetical protein
MQLETPRRLLRHVSVPLPRFRLRAASATWLATALTGAAVFVVYLTTLAPTVMWYDMGEFATTAATLGIAHNTGYPLLILTGKAFTFLPFGDTAWRVNLMSAVFTALAVALVFGIIHDLTREYVGAAVGALTLAFASTVWANATWATSYGMNLFFTAAIARCMLAWRRDRSPRALVVAALALGLGLGNHRLIVLAAPPSLLLLALGWRTLTRRTCVIAAAAFLVGLSVYVYLPVRGEMDPPLSWARPAEWRTYWSMFLNGQTPGAYWGFDLADRIDVLWVYPSYDLTWAGLALAAAGAVVLALRSRAALAYLLTLLALDAVVVQAYGIHNVYNYLTPGYLALGVLIGVAVAWLARAVPRLAEERAGVRPHLSVAGVAALAVLLPAFLLFRNYERVDRGTDYNALDFARTTLERVPPESVILTDSWSASPLWYVQLVEGDRRDVFVSPIFSVPGEDPGAFARPYLDQGRGVYVAEGLRVPTGELARDFTLQPVLLEGIERMVVDSLPKPRYRDDLVMTGSLFRLALQPADPVVTDVPPGAGRDLAFRQGLTLVGFQTDVPVVERGDVVRMDYYWRADLALGVDLSATTLMFDAGGRASQVRGFPLWSQPRDIGQGLRETAEWVPGVIYRESYFSLATRDLSPGVYDIKISVFDSTGDPAQAQSDATNLVTIGQIVVR